MERIHSQNKSCLISTTQVINDEPETSSVQTEELVLHLRPENESRVRWAEDTIDNEHLGKKKSKCCCIYKKKRKWDDSGSSDSECETGNCRGHVEKYKQNLDTKDCQNVKE